ncbi:hypothetical protein [Telmatospirillum sp. J64-1]|uniref:hypothetical protein n=1 Tax=Telmatospirillum sp. J64-1 TaxID=2502183 RepID=UPI00115EDC64|nr:hypothetical protein [Telmatospirillum sp. J64-1]
MKTRNSVIAAIERFCQKHRISERDFGVLAVRDHKFMRRLRSGAGITLTTIERAEAFIRAVDAGEICLTPETAA